MGSAPSPGNHPAMPDPARIARRSIALAIAAGDSPQRAIRRITAVVHAVKYWLSLGEPGFYGWLDEIGEHVTREARILPSPATSTQEDEHGDRSTSADGQGPARGRPQT